MFTVSLVSDDNSREVAIGEYCKKGGDPGNILDILGYFGNILDILEISKASTFIIKWIPTNWFKPEQFICSLSFVNVALVNCPLLSVLQ